MSKGTHLNELKPNEKMSLEDLQNLFPEYVAGASPVNKATKRGYRHKHRPVWLPAKPKISPAAYRRSHLGKKKKKNE